MKRNSNAQFAFLNLCILLGLLLFSAAALVTLLATSATGRTPHVETDPHLWIGGTDASTTGAITAQPKGGSCQYTITVGTGTIVPGITDIGNHCFNCGTLISLPFPFVLYNQTFNEVTVSSSGRLSFACDNEPGYNMTSCLPASPDTCPYEFTIFALWHDWYTGTGATGCARWENGCGVFTSISGTAPNRIFNIEWHVARSDNDALTAQFEVRLYENDPNKRFDVIYGYSQGTPGNGDAAGVQEGPIEFFTQDFCNVPAPQNGSSTYTLPPCATPTPTATPTTIVTNTNDSGPGSLRQALADANDGATINFDRALNGRTIGLTTGELAINKNVSINAPGPNLLGVWRSSQTSFRIFHVSPGFTARIAGLTISGGDGSEQGGGGILNDHGVLTMDSCVVQNSFAFQFNSGGGLYNDGSGSTATLTILDSSVSENNAYFAGGGIYNDASNGGVATLTITNSSVSNNSARFSEFDNSGGDGGGIYNSGGTLMLSNSTVSGNGAGTSDPFPAGSGGGISSYGTLSVTNSTINNNGCAIAGGGIASVGTLTVTNSTVSGNGATGQRDGLPWGYGGGIAGNVTFTNSTLSGNYANLSAGGIEGGGVITNSTISGNNNGGISVNGTLEIGSTILNAGVTGPNISNNGGTVISHGYNLSSDDGGGYLTGPGDQINTDPMLGALQDNGGPTMTHALLPDSPAINTGDPNFTPPPLYDQRGAPFVRVFDDRTDVGSIEVQPTPTPPPTPCTQYNITEGTDVIVPGTTDTGNHCIWCSTAIDLPFPFVLYNQTFNAVRVTSSGRLDFVCNNEPRYTESCLPVPPYDCPYDFTIFALWHDWSTTTGQAGCSTWANGCGIFTSISGAAPNRIFNIEWHVTRRENSPDAANFEVRLYENEPNKRFDVIYGAINGVSTGDAAGVQGPSGFFTADFCNVLAPQNTSRKYTMLPCPPSRPIPTPRPRPSPRHRP